MDEQRLIDLEIKVSHLELSLELLQDVVYAQQKELTSLQHQLQRQSKLWAESSRGGPDIGPANDKPPHY